MRTLFIAAGPYEWGSSRMRCYWPAKNMPDTQVCTFRDLEGQTFPLGFDNYIFQKGGDPILFEHLRDAGKRVYWDVCDPAWWWEPNECRALTEHVDGVVASNAALAADFTKWCGLPCEVIPDRLELEHFPIRREHAETSPVRLVWFGIWQNRIALFAAMDNLKRLIANGYKIQLTIFDNTPQEDWSAILAPVPVHHILWTLTIENEVIASHDIALLPKYPGPWGIVKSHNKYLTAWACGLPAVHGLFYHELEDLVSRNEYREAEARNGLDALISTHQAKDSAVDWVRLLRGEDIHADL